MAVPSHRLVPAFSAFAWNADRSMCAVCPNTNEVWIFANCADPDASNWVKQYVLKQHDLVVSGIDWHPVTNRIVTCSQDRSAFVWTLDAATDTWAPTVAMLRINRAALDVKWSPDGVKFAVATGTKSVCICTYERENNWWVSKHIKSHHSTILSVNWHPNSQTIVTGCCDFKARVVNAVEKTRSPEPFAAPVKFGEAYAEYPAKGWVEDVAFSPAGTVLAYVSHDCAITFVDFARGGVPVTVKHSDLPFTKLLFLSERTVVAAGHSRNPTLFAQDAAGNWGLVTVLDRGTKSTAKSLSSFGAARDAFSSRTRHGEAASSSVEGVSTVHQSTIVCVNALTPAGPVTSFTTAGIDGIIAFWNLADLEIDLAAAGLA